MIRALFFILLLNLPTVLRAQDASTVYEARYQVTGYLLRAANVCQADKKQIDATFALVSSDEMKAFSRAFPQLYKTVDDEWRELVQYVSSERRAPVGL